MAKVRFAAGGGGGLVGGSGAGTAAEDMGWGLDGGGASNGRVSLESGRSRVELVEWLVELARETPRMVVGFDFSFSYPAWFLRELGIGSAPEFWRLVADGQGEKWLHKDCEDARFWGRAGSRRHGKKPAEFCGEHAHRMLRRAETVLKVKAEIADPWRRRGGGDRSEERVSDWWGGGCGDRFVAGDGWVIAVEFGGVRSLAVRCAFGERAAGGGDFYAADDGGGDEEFGGGADGLSGEEAAGEWVVCGVVAGGVG